MRLFVAVELAPEIKANIKKLEPELNSPMLRITNPEMIHVTLRFIGEVDEAKVQEMESALAGVKAAPFSLKFKGVGAFPSAKFIRVVWVGCESPELTALADKVDEAIGKYCEKRAERFSEHVTIGRPRGPVQLGDFFEQNLGREFGEMQVKSFSLKSSVLAPGGAVHKTVKEFELE
jgi:2'-5' RNA ligase